MIALSRYNPTPRSSQGEAPWSSDSSGQLITYEPGSGSLPDALENLEGQHDASGLETNFFFSDQGWVVRFLWPDWPPQLSRTMKETLEAFHGDHPELLPIPEGSKEWEALSRGLRSDPASAQKVAESFDKHFLHRAKWARSEKDTRGAVTAKCKVEELGIASIHLSWRSFAADPGGPFNNDAEMRAYQDAVSDVSAWARDRIQSILDTLHGKLRALYGERFRGLYVFGSYARADAGVELPEDSDLDVAVLLTDVESPYKEIQRTGEITSDLSLEHGILVSLVHIRESDFREGRTNFTRVISETAIPVK